MRTEDYFDTLVKDGSFIIYHGGKTTLTNAGFRSSPPYDLPDGWVSHPNLCTACEILMNFPFKILCDVDHVTEYEFMVRAAEHGCFYCAQALRGIRRITEYNNLPILSYFPIRAAENARDIAFRGAYNDDGWHWWFRKVVLKSAVRSQPTFVNTTHTFGNTPGLREQISSWLTTCESGHEMCCSSATVSPTRLLYVGSSQGDEVLRLVEPSINSVRYLTLSYCWGKNQLVKLLRRNIDQFKSFIDVATLHKTSQDAVHMTRALGIEYLWVDSLCIIQDDEIDTKREINRMHVIYSGAVLNLVADSAIDCDGGLFGNKESAAEASAVTIVPRQFDHAHAVGRITTAYVVLEERWARNALKGGTTAGRAWCVQERMLAPRMVQFTQRQAFWQCKSLIASELFPQGTWWSESTGIRDMQEPFHLQNFDGQAGSIDRIIADLVASKQTSEHWNSFVRYYSQSSLTFEEDRYSAMAGVVGRILDQRPEFTKDYIVGTWRQHLPASLAWERLRRSKLSRIPRGRRPTWSWLALEGEVMMDAGEINHFAELVTVEVYGAGPQGILKPSAGFVIIEASAFTVQQIAQEPLLWKAVCQGCQRKLILVHGFDHVIDDRYGLGVARMDSFQVNPVKWDWVEDEPHTKSFTLVPITARQAYLCCLVLVDVSDARSEPKYERRGLMSFCDRDGFDDEDLWKDKLTCQLHKQRIEIW